MERVKDHVITGKHINRVWRARNKIMSKWLIALGNGMGREKRTYRVDVLIELESIESCRFTSAVEAQHDDVQSRVSGRQIL